jgi:rhodanese-related sulfurtransferase
MLRVQAGYARCWTGSVRKRLQIKAKGGIGRFSGVKMTAVTSGSPAECKQHLDAGHGYLDVRTPEEYNSGCYPGSINIPVMLKVDGAMQRNPEFERLVQVRGRSPYQCRHSHTIDVSVPSRHPRAGFAFLTLAQAEFNASHSI